jgi:hypothetical protein
MDDELVDYALARILDDIRIGEWATGEVDKTPQTEGPPRSRVLGDVHNSHE